MVWGAISLIGFIGLGSYVLFLFGSGNQTQINKATKSDVRFVLNWCDLGDERIEEVLNSKVSARSFTGDHHDVYKIRISHVEIHELRNLNNNQLGNWYRCDSLPLILDEALEFIGGWQNDMEWFPKEEEIRTKNFYVYPWSISCHGISPDAAKLIFVEPSDNMIYYVSAKM